LKLGDKLKNLRKQKGLTQEDLARLLGTANSTVSMYERGARVPDIDTMRRIAEIFRVDMNYLLGHSASFESQNLTEGEQMWMELYHKLSDETRGLLIKTMDSFDSLSQDKQELALRMLLAVLGNQ
jgi:transcriptional regulator with XRE-family HTH domain